MVEMEQTTVVFRKTGYTFQCEVNGIDKESNSLTFNKLEFTSEEKLNKITVLEKFLELFKTKFKKITSLKIIETIIYESVTEDEPFDKEGETYEFHEIDFENIFK